MSRSSPVREAVAFVVAPIGAAVTVFLYIWITFGGLEISMIGFFAWVAVFAYPAEVVIALPGHLLLKRQGVHSRIAYALLGAGTGATPFVLLAFMQRRVPLAWRFPLGLWVGVAAGIASALVFWSLAVPTKPETPHGPRVAESDRVP